MVLNSVWDPHWSGPQSSYLPHCGSKIQTCHHADSKLSHFFVLFFLIAIFYIYIFYVGTKSFLKGQADQYEESVHFAYFMATGSRTILHRDLDPGEPNQCGSDPKH
jgi:hypothetical protein